MNPILTSLASIICLSLCLSCAKITARVDVPAVAETKITEELIRDAYATQSDINSPAMNALKQQIQVSLTSGSIYEMITNTINKLEHRHYRPKDGDITVKLSDCSLHLTDYSGKPQIFIVVSCFIKGTGQIVAIYGTEAIYDKDRSVVLVGPFDVEKLTFKMWGKFINGAQPDLKFINLRKNAPEYILLSVKNPGIPHCEECNPAQQEDAIVVGFDRKENEYKELLRVQPYLSVATSGSSYEEWAEFAFSDWINEKYREIIVTTTREYSGTEDDEILFHVKEEIYSWNDQESLYLRERRYDGKIEPK